MERFLKDNTMHFVCGKQCYGFNKILSQSIRQYTPTCWASVVIADDSITEDNIKLYHYVLNGEKIEGNEIRLNSHDIKALKTALSNYN